MRVVHISKVTGIAGSEGHLLMLLPALAQQGVEARMLVLEDPRRPADSFCHEMAARGVPVETLPIRRDVAPALVERLAARLRALRPHLVHTHLIHADLYGLFAAQRAGVPCAVSTRHNDNPFRRRLLIRWLNGQAMRRAARVIAISQALARFVAEVEGVERTKIVTIPYGFQPPHYPPDARQRARAELGYGPHEPLVGVFGRLIRQKGVDVLLLAFPRVRERFPQARLLVVGDGALRGELEAQARALGIAEAVRFTGWVERAHRLMPACDVIAMPSRWEGFGLVALEAMGASRPLVASRVSALPEIVVDGETGWLVPPEDAHALAEAIIALLADAERAAAMGQAGYRRLLAEFPVQRMVQATHHLYRELVGEGSQ